MLAPWDRELTITMKWWCDDQAEGRKIRAAIVALHQGFHAQVLYVAATRARQLLVISRWGQKPNDGAWGVFSPFLGQATELAIPGTIEVPPVLPIESSA